MPLKLVTLWNGTVSAQNTVIAVNCRWEQDIQSKEIDKTRNLLYTWRKLQKETICFQAFIVKRSFILNSIASETVTFRNCQVSAQHTVIAVNCRWKQDIQGKDINKKHKLIYRWIKLQKDTISFQAFIVKRSFILNSIASETGHFLEIVKSVHSILSLQLTVVENKTFKVKTLTKNTS